MKKLLKRILPQVMWYGLLSAKRVFLKGMRRGFEFVGLTVARRSDYYSPLPAESDLAKNLQRWDKPSSLMGITYDIDKYKMLLTRLLGEYGDEHNRLPEYAQNVQRSFGPGYPELDAMLLYMMIRDLRSRRYMEVGSGLSTYYCSLAAQKNAEQGAGLEMICIEPFPYPQLRSVEGIEIIERSVQNVAFERFLCLQENDVLFIDSSHVLKIDGDVAYLYLEIMPRLKRGVVIHIHDIPFPYNTPLPAKQWVLCRTEHSPDWPRYWNEAMVLQAFLAFNTSFEIIMSMPLIRYYDEGFLETNVDAYKPVAVEPNTFSSIWLRKIA